MEITHLRTKSIGMKTITDNSQPISKISYRQQLSTLQDEGQQETKDEKQNEAIAIPPNETDELTHCFRTDLKKKEKEIVERNMYRNNKVAAKAKIISRRAE